MSTSKDWWRGATFYQIYPRSFCDSNDDGIGDLPGITGKLEHIADLGVDAIWISPFFKSPMKDFGYDVSDFRDIAPIFGTLEDFDTLLEKAHNLGLKIIIDLVLSHTSDQHPWFTENPDYYVWADAATPSKGKDEDRGQSNFSSEQAQGAPRSETYASDATTPSEGKGRRPPNNWVSVFGGSAWEWHEERSQYYLHNFLKEQPDLNYHNPAVQQEALDIARFWLDKGVDGFRLDVINFLFHDQELRDNPPRDQTLGAATQFEGEDPYSQQQHIYDKSRPEMIPFLKKFRALMDEYPHTMTLGEIGDDAPYERAAEYTAPGLLNTCYNPSFMAGTQKKLTATLIRTPVETALEQSNHPSWAFSNHDVVRAASRWLPESNGFTHNPQFSQMLIALLFCLPGIPFLYQGEELGLPEAKLEYDQLQDPWGKHLWPEWQGRDGCRTPMPWKEDTATNGWLPIPQEHIKLNVAAQDKQAQSTLNMTRDFLRWRKNQDALMHGTIEFHETGNNSALHFTRHSQTQTLKCAFDFDRFKYKIENA